MLEELDSHGFHLGVCSNKPHQYTEQIMERMFSWVPWAMILGQQDSLPESFLPPKGLTTAE